MGSRTELPAALVENGTLPGQRVIRGTLSSSPGLVAAVDLRGPALVIVGEVVGPPFAATTPQQLTPKSPGAPRPALQG